MPDTEMLDSENDDSPFEKVAVHEFGLLIPPKDWVNQEKQSDVHIFPMDPSNHLSAENSLKFMESSVVKNVQALDKIFFEMLSFYRSNLEDPDEDDGHFGRLVKEMHEGESCFFLRGSISSKEKYRIDLSDVKDYVLFSGQFVIVKGIMVRGNVIRAKEIGPPEEFLRPFTKPSFEFESTLNLVVAAGPFNKLNSIDCPLLEKLLDYVTTFKPNFLIITGPILSVSEEMYDNDIKQVFSEILSTISNRLNGSKTWVYVISSPEEWHHINVYPSPPYDTDPHYPSITFAPSPSLFNIAGIVVGISSVDILFQLSRNLTEKTSDEEGSKQRLQKICDQILHQNSFYPLYPPDRDVNLEITKLKYCQFKTTPHLMITPSILRNFVKSVKSCIFVNPENLRKGFIGRIQIRAPKDTTNLLSVESLTSVQIIKLT